MRKSDRIAGVLFGALLVLSAVAGIAEILGLSVCWFGVPMHAWLVLPLLIGAVGSTVCLCRSLRRRAAEAQQRLPYTLLRIVLVLLCVLLVCISLPAAMLNAEAYASSCLSADKAHKVFFEADAVGGEPIAHVYKRYSPFLMAYRNSVTLYGFSGEIEEIEVVWEDSYCTVYYVGFNDDAQSSADEQVLSRKLFYTAQQ